MALSGAEAAVPASPAELTGALHRRGRVCSWRGRAMRCARRWRPAGAIEPDLLEREQHAVHGLAWLATYVQALRQMHAWALRLGERGRLGELERLMLRAATGEYLARIAGGIPMSQGETARLHQLHLDARRDQRVRRRSRRAARDRGRHGGAAARAPGHPDRRRPVRRLGSRGRYARHGARAVPALCRGAGRAPRPWLACAGRADPARGDRRAGRARRVRPDRTRGLGRTRHGQGRDVRGHRGALARLHRRRLARHALGDRRRADPPGRHRRAESQLSAAHRLGRDHPDGGVHRAQHRLRSRLAADPRGAWMARAIA